MLELKKFVESLEKCEKKAEENPFRSTTNTPVETRRIVSQLDVTKNIEKHEECRSKLNARTEDICLPLDYVMKNYDKLKDIESLLKGDLRQFCSRFKPLGEEEKTIFMMGTKYDLKECYRLKNILLKQLGEIKRMLKAIEHYKECMGETGFKGNGGKKRSTRKRKFTDLNGTPQIGAFRSDSSSRRYKTGKGSTSNKKRSIKYRTHWIPTRKSKIKERLTKKRRNINDFIHKALYQKKNDCGLGTYTKVDLPEDTIIIRETPVRLNETNDLQFYTFKLIKKLLTNHKRDFLSLVPEAIDSHAKFNEELMKKGRERFFPKMAMDELKLYYLKYKRNAFSFEGSPGILFYATRLNHSCVPNVSYKREGNHMVFRTKRAIKAGEEIFDAYISPNLSKSERKEQLLARYGFDCQCCRCKLQN